MARAQLTAACFDVLPEFHLWHDQTADWSPAVMVGTIETQETRCKLLTIIRTAWQNAYVGKQIEQPVLGGLAGGPRQSRGAAEFR